MTTHAEKPLAADGTADFISMVRDACPKLSKSDKKIADFLLETPDRFIRASVKEVAAVTGVSDATVVRFGRNLGCEGFKDLKILLTQYLAAEQARKDAASGQVLSPAGSFEEQVYHSALEVLDRAFHDVRRDMIDKAATIISEGVCLPAHRQADIHRGDCRGTWRHSQPFLPKLQEKVRADVP